MKKTKTDLSKNIELALPMIEEITETGHLPICVIGFSLVGKNKLATIFSTLSDEHDSIVYEICKQFVSSHSEKYEKK